MTSIQERSSFKGAIRLSRSHREECGVYAVRREVFLENNTEDIWWGFSPLSLG